MSQDETDLVASGCRLVRSGKAFVGRQGLTYAVGISAEAVGADAIHLQMVTILPRARAKAHQHVDHETAIYALSGISHVWHGPVLEHHSVVVLGDYFYIPAGVPYIPYNPGDEPVTALIARTDPNEQESVMLLPDLDRVHEWPEAE